MSKYDLLIPSIIINSSHLSQSILEAGIPIDRVAGVSIGSCMGGLWAQERDISQVTVKARNFSLKMSQKWRMALDLTWPHSSMMTGFGFNALVEEPFGDTNIEDLWLPFFTITTDITVSDMKVHDSGCLWRYVRSSMSLAGYMPPLCDPQVSCQAVTAVTATHI